MTIARGAAASAIIAGSAAAVCAERSTLRTGLEAIGHARPGWVAAGVALEFLSMARPRSSASATVSCWSPTAVCREEEQIGGYDVVECADRDAAIRWRPN